MRIAYQQQYEDLANAVIKQAVTDYICLWRGHSVNDGYGIHSGIKGIEHMNKFFHSPFFHAICNVDSDRFVEIITQRAIDAMHKKIWGRKAYHVGLCYITARN